MGRVKIEIKKIENPANRNVTYMKRGNGLMKKAYELSVLCDVDVAVITFSPSGKLTQFCKDDRIEEVITRYANTPQPERTKRKLESAEYLDKAVKKLTVERGLEVPKVSYEDLELEVQQLRSQLYTAMVQCNYLEQERRQLGLDVMQNTLEKTSVQMNPLGADAQGGNSDVKQNTLEKTSFQMNPLAADAQGNNLDVMQNTLQQFLFEMNSSGAGFEENRSLYTDLEELFSVDVRTGPCGPNV